MNDKIRVLHIIKSLGRGGAETLLPETLKLHDKKGFEWHYIYFLPWKDQMVSQLTENGGKVTCLSASNNIQILLRIQDVIEYVLKFKIHIIHSHLPWAGILSRVVGRKLSHIPIVYTEHNKQQRYHFITRWMNLATINWSTCVVAVSADVERSIRQHKKSLTVPLQTIFNGVNVEYFAPGLFDGSVIRRALGIPANALVVGTVAVFRFQKRLELWLETAARIATVLDGVHFIIVGDGPMKTALFKKRSDLKIEHNVHFVGLQTEVRPYLSAFDLYMMSSVFEGLPIALLEAMAIGCPVVSTDAGGVKEVIRHDIDGMLCPVDHPEKLAPLAISVLKSFEKRLELSTQGRKRILECFSMQKMVQSLETLYHHIFSR